MLKRLTAVASLALFLCLMGAGASHAATSLSLEEQIASLTARIQQLQTQLTPSVSLTHTLSFGSSGEEVRSLQTFLASHPEWYPEAIVSGYFGAKTYAAVGRYQLAKGIVTGPTSPGYGIVGPKTRAMLIQNVPSSTPQPPENQPSTTTSTTTPPVQSSSNTTISNEGSYVAGDGQGTIVYSRGHASTATAFTAGGVAFDGVSSLKIASLSAADSPTVSYSYWYWQPSRNDSATYWVVDPEGGYRSSATGNFSTHGIFAGVSDSGGHGFSAQTPELSYGTWHHVLFSSTIGSPSIGEMYIDGSLVTSTSTTNGSTMQFNGLTFWIGDDSYGDTFTGYMADFWFAPGQSLLTNGVIPPSVRSKFRDSVTGKPVNLGADGSTPTGVAPAVFLHKSSTDAASTFSNNLGTGGSFTTNGTFTNAPSNPSD